ncbi:triacylglycerol lipase [Emydomyces testavorans]|uniref:Triacylglycerol lipase n=1 Tax=Emydomyces testavorans TaxID=2070801 RepID=A0AAF0IGF9_9EURO|nr:triacylglycerol lipase [Emydomyces testavorans]
MALLRRLKQARTYQEWLDTASALDEIYGLNEWRSQPDSPLYNYQNISARLDALRRGQADDDPLRVCNTIRTGLIRNMVNIAVPGLYDKAFAGTKRLIEQYAVEQTMAVRYLMGLGTSQSHRSGFTAQAKFDFIRGARQGLGRSTLLLQGGSVLGTCHIGVVRTLYYERMLPRVITGTATGAFVAALICIKTNQELELFLDGKGIDLAAFERQRREDKSNLFPILARENGYGWLRSISRQVIRLVDEQYLLGFDLLRECARAILGNITFEEAYAKTKRILNITVAAPRKGGTPNLLNYLTAPNVLIWSAVMASNVSLAAKSPVQMWCKSETGQIVLWEQSADLDLKSWYRFRCSSKESPLRFLPQLFNVNHFIISQARPFIIPLFREEMHRPGGQIRVRTWKIFQCLKQLAKIEIRYRLRQLDALCCLPAFLHRIFLEENIPGSCVVLLPDISLWDLTKIFEKPSREGLKYWILKGERGVWPSMNALKVRCVLEMELENAYQELTRRQDNELLTW